MSQQPYPKPVRFHGRGAGRSSVSYLALHRMGFSVPRRLLVERCALTAPFHPCRRFFRNAGGLFSVALSVEKFFNFPPACISKNTGGHGPPLQMSYAASRPLVFGLSSSSLATGSDSPPFQNREENKSVREGLQDGQNLQIPSTNIQAPEKFQC